MATLQNRTVIVAGGTGNIGGFLVSALLRRGATVIVPSRSERRVEALAAFLRDRGDGDHLERLITFNGDIGTEESADVVRDEIFRKVGPPDAVVASLGRFIPAPSILEATAQQLREALDGYLLSHFAVARTFLPGLVERGGTYVFINGPLAVNPWKGSGAGLVSVATAAQQMLFRTLAQELESGRARVVEFIVQAFVRERETQPSSPISADSVGAAVARIIADADPDMHGRTIQGQEGPEIV